MYRDIEPHLEAVEHITGEIKDSIEDRLDARKEKMQQVY
jgi:hypothetical protein